MPNLNLPTPGGDVDNWGQKLNDNVTTINQQVDQNTNDIVTSTNTANAAASAVSTATTAAATAQARADAAYTLAQAGHVGAIVSSDITDSTSAGRAVLSAANTAAIRTQLGITAIAVVDKVGDTWPSYTNTATAVVIWRGPEPSPSITDRASGGMTTNDIRLITRS